MMRGTDRCMIVPVIASELVMGDFCGDALIGIGCFERLGSFLSRCCWDGSRGDAVFERWSVFSV